ncbi:MAG: hypothetical protein AAGC78_18235 [Cellvibrio sp.]|uniref:hypothetical protein n=1 Tax=Cellvibrio sp. TaxID=1965322 RepID=UPI0031A9DD89
MKWFGFFKRSLEFDDKFFINKKLLPKYRTTSVPDALILLRVICCNIFGTLSRIAFVAYVTGTTIAVSAGQGLHYGIWISPDLAAMELWILIKHYSFACY